MIAQAGNHYIDVILKDQIGRNFRGHIPYPIVMQSQYGTWSVSLSEDHLVLNVPYESPTLPGRAIRLHYNSIRTQTRAQPS